jgi:hypothetical protein
VVTVGDDQEHRDIVEVLGMLAFQRAAGLGEQ